MFHQKSSNQKISFMKQMLTTVALVLSALLVFGQTAQVQVIHNSPLSGTMSGPVVDIYVNGSLLPPLTAVPFQAATPFLDVPAGFPITVDVKVNPSTPADPSVATFPLGALADGGTYVVMAAGEVGNASTPFNLYVNGNARETAEDPALVDLAVFHGSPDAPNVDVDARTVGNLLGDLAFGSFTEYLSVAPGLYYLDVRAAGDPDIVATFQADLSALAGGAATVFASGFLSDMPGFGLFAALPDGAVIELPLAPVARVQIIHNSPAPTVDIYANGAPLLSDLAFREATEFQFLPAEAPISLAVVPAGGDPATDDVYGGAPLTLENGRTYVVVADGIAGDLDFPFTLHINDEGRESGSTGSSVDFSILHGSPGAPAVDVSVSGVVSGMLAGGLTYGNFSSYIVAPAAPYFLEVEAPSAGLTLPFYADLEPLGGQAATVFASGLVGGSPGFGLFAALADGTVVELPLIDEFAQVNIIHNSPEPTVDIYLNGALAVADFEFRNATGFLELPASVPLSIGVALAGSASVADTIANFRLPDGLASEENYIVTAAGIAGDPDFPFTLQIRDGARLEADDPSLVDLTVLHGSPAAPSVDVAARAVGTLITDLSYGTYTDYLSVGPDLYYLDVRAAGDPGIVATFEADLSGLTGGAATVFASGILGGSPAFGLFAALPDGMVVELPSVRVARAQIIHNSPTPTVDIYVDDVLAFGEVAFRNATGYFFLPAETALNLKVVPAGGDPATDAVYDENVALEANGDSYVIMASGLAGDPDQPFGLQLFKQSREAAAGGTGIDLLLFHGAPDAPEVDVVVDANGAVLFDDVAFNEFSADYVNVPEGIYQLNVTPSDDNGTIVRAFEADLNGLDGGAAVAFASGFLTQDDPAFGVWVALPDGTTFALPEVILSTDDLGGRLAGFRLSPNPVSGQAWIDLQLNEAVDAQLQLTDLTGRVVRQIFQGQLSAGVQALSFDTQGLPAGMYLLTLRSEQGVSSLRVVVNN